jgi:hypothetical protein
MRTAYFDMLAEELWDANVLTLQAVRRFGDRERTSLEAIILNRYGKSISLRGTPEEVQATLEAARRS